MSRRRRKRTPPEKKRTLNVRWVVIVVVAVLIGTLLVLKAHKSDTNPANPVGAVNATSPAGVVIVPTQAQPAPLPEAQLDQLLAAGMPAFVFFHSNNCVQCLRMIEIVAQVHPDFAGSVPLVDVNVYDERNGNLLQRAGIRFIPTLVFVDRTGQRQEHVGVMKPDALREQLQQLAGE